MSPESTTNRVLRYTVSVNDQPRTLPSGKVLMVTPNRQATTTPVGSVEVWIEATTPTAWPNTDPIGHRTVQVMGTGYPIPAGATHLGSCLDGPLVWHLYELA